jgi:hypothetical protein
MMPLMRSGAGGVGGKGGIGGIGGERAGGAKELLGGGSPGLGGGLLLTFCILLQRWFSAAPCTSALSARVSYVLQ